MAKVGIVGTGVMGRGIAQLFAASGYEVLLYDTDRSRASEAAYSAGAMIDRDAAKGRLTADAAAMAKSRLVPTASLEPFATADLVIEAIVESLAAKRELFDALENIVPPQCILATNTSSLLVTEIAAAARHPERVCGLHFFNPAPLMKITEVVAAVKTSSETLAQATRIIESTGHTAVRTADLPGFLINHAGRGLYTEGQRIVAEGIASTEDVDLVMSGGADFRMGPFELLDLTGLDVSFNVMQQIYHQFFEEPRFRPQPFVARQYSAGLFGRKVGQGFYRYDDGKKAPSPAVKVTDFEPRPIWLDGSDEITNRLRSRLEALGIELEGGDHPDEASIIVVAPVGDDTTTMAVNRGFDPRRTFAIDPLFCDGGRLTLMGTAASRADYRDSLRGMLEASGVAVTTIHDSPGFIAQRIIATIINIACDIAQQRIAAPKDIDLGAKLGLGYPAGPLELGDKLGADTIMQILNRMYAFYCDPRYRPSPWLKRRALLNVSLISDEA
ncbi:3-hydroxyacyl-CoA dehydrogenase (plasmid) [Ancylobacter polymorphus]|uniref:3-hydroxyacyl-CoA dehydrogenase n=1 Tax=Ancylobacter polymorphus TaxID=223390 RepID=A0A9E7A602_9HYPH|nr:3-hydroxyacyl-CoA dehydrogenase [Ancylobacter polymorphus]UOK73498.1 3-hydroxyacyl-CoA dehydrogenase [Ancylobacter polymorphus]